MQKEAAGIAERILKDFSKYHLDLVELETQLLLLEQNEILPPELLATANGYNEEVQKMLQTLLKK
ncbi:MAG: hypothetical protein WD059_06735 [Balneolaceae bacterium]